MRDEKISRRTFIRNTSLAATGFMGIRQHAFTREHALKSKK